MCFVAFDLCFLRNIYLCNRKLSSEGDAGNSCSPQKDSATTIMNWIILIIAGLCECGFTFCLGNAKNAHGATHIAWLCGFAVFTIASMCLLAKASHGLPLGTAYPVWTGIGALGTVLIGIFVFHEPTSLPRLFFIATLVASVVGLKIVS